MTKFASSLAAMLLVIVAALQSIANAQEPLKKPVPDALLRHPPIASQTPAVRLRHAPVTRHTPTVRLRHAPVTTQTPAAPVLH